jgi:hypothetical protein
VPKYFRIVETGRNEESLSKNERLAYLRAKLASAHAEKEALTNLIKSTLTNPTRRRQAIRRYSAVVADAGRTAHELQKLVVDFNQASAAQKILEEGLSSGQCNSSSSDEIRKEQPP